MPLVSNDCHSSPCPIHVTSAAVAVIGHEVTPDSEPSPMNLNQCPFELGSAVPDSSARRILLPLMASRQPSASLPNRREDLAADPFAYKKYREHPC